MGNNNDENIWLDLDYRDEKGRDFSNDIKLSEDIFKENKNSDTLDLSLLDEFSSKQDVLEAFSSILPETIVVGDTVCTLERLYRLEEFFPLMIFHSINSFFKNILFLDCPFKGGYESSENALTGAAFNFISIDEDLLGVLSYVAPLVLKNYHLFETMDILNSNASSINKMRHKKVDSYFLNNKGEFVTLHRFALDNLQQIKEIPYELIGQDTHKAMETKLSDMKEFKEEFEAFNNMKNNILSPSSSTFDQNVSFNNCSKAFNFIEQKDFERIERESNMAVKGEAEEARGRILKKSEHIKQGIGLKTVEKRMLNDLDTLKERFPNFIEVIDYIKGSVSLSLLEDNTEFGFEPFLMLGSPGLGKTVFAKELGKVLDVPSDIWPVSQFNQSFTLTGLDLGWASGKTGKIFNYITKENVGNPIVVLDEIDKTQQGVSNGGDINTVFLQLFEKETARELKDEAMDVPMDASYMNWICTANDIGEISQPLLSRLKIFTINKPKSYDMPKIIDSIYSKLLNEQANGHCFAPSLPDNFYKELQEFEPRKVVKILKDVMMYSAQSAINTNASLDGIVLDDFSLRKAIEHEPKQRHKNMR